ncbi:MAG: PilZ domain-containing protein [Candidatus Methylomirabilia bacterium]
MDDPLSHSPGQAPVRRYPRMAGEYVVAYRRQLPGGNQAAAEYSRTRTLGLGGLMFESEKALEHDETLQLEIVFGEKTIKAAGVVVYVDRQDNEPSRVGVQFTEISEDDRDALLGVYLQQEYRIDPA